ncbi:MAG: prephenate dehydrogenase/arogenate dehydrogenase family protein [Coriobacteriia bacterium]|nr:prephenate dehydrogenase/arogenate dehydrogenase family protein [Coriobacteriia bacterium]
MSVTRLTVIGLGLIGGSVALAARRAMPGLAIRAIDTDEQALTYALEEGVVDEALPLAAAREAGWFAGGRNDLIVLGAPPAEAAGWLGRLAELGYDGIVTDVSSTKRLVVDAARAARDAGARYRFVGGHPMAGSERSGVTAASEALFDGAYYVLTPTDATDMDAYRTVHEFVTALGARVLSIDAHQHDEAVAVVSHVPHVTAAALVDLAVTRAGEMGADLLRLGAGGFKDMTRIAAGDPDLWTGICLGNSEALSRGVRDLGGVLERFAAALDEGDVAAVRAWLAGPADVRRALPARWVPATASLRELTVAVNDRPGVVGIVTTAVSRAGCNIEDIEIDHQSEDSAVLRLVLTDEGDAEALVADLRDRGFEPQVAPLEEV